MSFIIRRRVSDLNFKTVLLANSKQFTVGDAVIATQTTSDATVNVTTGANTTTSIFGVIVALIQAGHISEITTIATQSDNLTNGANTIANGGQWFAQVELVQNIAEVEATLDAVAGTTTGSYLPGYFKLGTSTTLNAGAGVLSEGSYVVSGASGSSADGLQFFSTGTVTGVTGSTTVRGWFTNQ